MTDCWIENGNRVLFIGDSITDCGRRGPNAPYGAGYVKMFIDIFTARRPAWNVEWVNKGIGGHKISDLWERWEDDVIYHKPDRLSIKIGINDLHSFLGAGDVPGAVSPAKFADLYETVLSTTKQKVGCPVCLITPFYISTVKPGEPAFRAKVLELLPSYIETVEAMAARYDTKLLNLHAMFAEQLKYRDAETFCPEPVHPHPTGHLLMAEALAELLGV